MNEISSDTDVLDDVMALPKLSWDDYKERAELNASTLVCGKKSMLSMKNCLAGTHREETPALQFGNKYHSLILEPEEFESTYCVMPNYAAMPENRTGKGGASTSWATTFAKTSKDNFIADAEENGQQVITRDEYDKGLRMVESIESNPVACALVNNGEKEVTLFGEINGVPCRSRLDICGSYIADIKGTQNASAHRFGTSAANLHYTFKLAFYRELYRQNFGFQPSVYLIAVETKGDFECAVYQVGDEQLDDKYLDVQMMVNKYKLSKESGIWPGCDGGANVPLPLFVPNWAMDEGDGLDWAVTE